MYSTSASSELAARQDRQQGSVTEAYAQNATRITKNSDGAKAVWFHWFDVGESRKPATGLTARASARPATSRRAYLPVISMPMNTPGVEPRWTRSNTLDRPDLRAVSTAATTCAGLATGWLLTETMRSPR